MVKERKKLIALRKQYNLRQIDVAQAIGLSASYYGMIESGKRTPILEDAKKIADFFQVTIDELFFAS